MHDKTSAGAVSQGAQKNLFRGKSKETGKMVFGNLISVPSANYFCILPQPEDIHPMDVPYLDGEIGTIDGCAVPVYPQTVGQFTGETDWNGVRIFEGDIVDHSAYDFPLVVKWDGGGFELWLGETYIDRLDKYSAPSCVVIGNIYDNPEPL